MSKETDGILLVWKASGIGGKITSVTSSAMGRATDSYHGRKGTPSEDDPAGFGLAVDMDDFIGGTAFSEIAMAQWRFYAAINDRRVKQGKPGTAELIYSYAPTYIKNGKHRPVEELRRLFPKTYELHLTHVHVAVNKGTILTLADIGMPVVSPATPPITLKDDDMRLPTDIVDACSTPTLGGSWRLERQGGVITTGDAPFHGSYFSLSEKTRQGPPREFCAIEYVPSTNGYRIHATDGGFYDFFPGVAFS